MKRIVARGAASLDAEGAENLRVHVVQQIEAMTDLAAEVRVSGPPQFASAFRCLADEHSLQLRKFFV